jgi:hypothetical protein
VGKEIEMSDTLKKRVVFLLEEVMNSSGNGSQWETELVDGYEIALRSTGLLERAFQEGFTVHLVIPEIVQGGMPLHVIMIQPGMHRHYLSRGTGSYEERLADCMYRCLSSFSHITKQERIDWRATLEKAGILHSYTFEQAFMA